MNNKNQFVDISHKLIAIMGPTASGKTALACHLYDLDPSGFDIISVDSALVYRDMNIGTAKPTQTELVKYPHALVNIIEPIHSYSAAQFVKDATMCIKQCQAKGKVPILVGGTMMYFKALFGGMDDLPESQAEIRQSLTEELNSKGIQTLYNQLAMVDSVTANRLNPTDTQRIIRALEVYKISGRPLSSLQTNETPTLPKAWQIIGIEPERKLLHQRIEQRLEGMWQQGFLDEVRYLMKHYDLVESLPAMRSVGYRQVFHYLTQTKQTKDDRQMMQDKALFATRQLAKRQCTWLRKFRNIYDLQNFTSAELAIKNIVL